MLELKQKSEAHHEPVQTSNPDPIYRTSGKVSQTRAIVALILNILVLPGLGSLIGGRTGAGIWQLVLSTLPWIVVLILAFTNPLLMMFSLSLAIPLSIAAWIWGLVTGIRLIKEAEK